MPHKRTSKSSYSSWIKLYNSNPTMHRFTMHVMPTGFITTSTKPKKIIKKYFSLTDITDDVNYEKASITFVAKQYDEAIRTAKNHLEKIMNNSNSLFYILLYYTYNTLNNSINTKAAIEQYFTWQAEENLIAKDHLLKAKFLLKFPDNEKAVAQSFDESIAFESDPDGQQTFMEEIHQVAKNAKAYLMETL
ncbi:MAG: hypothetical protein ACMUEM_02720 [Flavobacteriales bacterium AspAUS03]